MDKLKAFIAENFGGKVSRFAVASGISQGHLSNLLSGRREASRNDLIRIFKATNGQVRDVDLYPELVSVGAEQD